MDDSQNLENLSTEQLIEMVQERTGAGVNLSFPGKTVARQIGRRVRPRVQQTVKKYSIGSSEDQAHNLVLEGDNLQALASLYRWRGHVDLILTDPPYNTGNDFRYNDRWDKDPNDPGLGEFVRADDLARHTKWMKFMYPRLHMMHAMLKPGGVLAICIDYRELFHLGQMLDELFHEKNRLAIINWEKTTAPKSANAHVSTSTEYVLVYARGEDRVTTNRGDRREGSNSRYRNPDNDPHGAWREGNLTAPEHRKLSSYGIQSPFTGEMFYPAGNGHWRRAKPDIKRWLEEWGSTYAETSIGDGEARALVVKEGSPGTLPRGTRQRALEVLNNGPWPFVWFGLDGTGRPRVKTYLSRVQKGSIPVTYWADDQEPALNIGSVSWGHTESGRSSDGVSELTSIVGSGHGFETVKPMRLIQKIIQIWCPVDGLVLDPFAGSGTTGHAVLSLNAATKADRRFILVEQGRPELGDSYARALTADRLKRVIAGNWINGKGVSLGGGYCFKTLRKQVDAEVVLQMERDEMVDTVIASHHDANRRRGSSLIRVDDPPYRYLVARNADGHGFYLVWDGPAQNTDLTEEVYETCVAEGAKEGLQPVYHVYARYNLFGTEDVQFYRIPDQILIDFGFDLRTEAYTGVAGS